MSRAGLLAAASVGLPVLSACGGGGGASGEQTASVADANVSAPAPKAFIDATASSGINYDSGYLIQPVRDQLIRFSTSGVTAGDYDGDGDIDLFIVRGDIGANLLYRNDGSGRFSDVAAAAGVANTASPTDNYRHSGPAFADMDGDGDLDLFIGGVFGDPSFIFANEGDGTFSDVTTGSGIDAMTAEHNIAASFGDYDLDGDLDMFIAHWGTRRDMANPGDTEHLWRNDSTATAIRFTSVSEAAGISPSILTLDDPLVAVDTRDYTFTASFARINDDLFPDLVVAADYNQSMVFQNNGDGTFENVTDVTVITDTNGMGSTLGDYDDDGDLDWFVTSIYEESAGSNPAAVRDGNRLYRNDNGTFTDITASAGVVDGAWGWGACFMDLENDGDLDIYHTNGWNEEFIDDRSRAFVSHGTGHFTDNAEELGLSDTEEGRGVVCADFDRDGDVDILQLHRGLPVAATMWRNENSGSNNYLAVKLNGNAPNTEAAGARIFVEIGQRTMMREVIIGNNFESQNPASQVFGLGSSTQVDELRVEWPDGQVTNHGVFAAGQTIALSQ